MLTTSSRLYVNQIVVMIFHIQKNSYNNLSTNNTLIFYINLKNRLLRPVTGKTYIQDVYWYEYKCTRHVRGNTKNGGEKKKKKKTLSLQKFVHIQLLRHFSGKSSSRRWHFLFFFLFFRQSKVKNAEKRIRLAVTNDR